MYKYSTLWRAPTVNPINRKARSIPGLNPINKYGRVFFFSWFGFMIAFWSWYAFPPLLATTIKDDLKLTDNDVANSNIAALAATLLIRLLSGPACDRFGPRKVFVVILLAGAIPTALAGTATTANGLLALRFFTGILGGSFVPCQVWSTGFFDKNIVGSANALTGGFGNAGGGITYFVMPAIFDSLVKNQRLTPHVAWRVAYVVPSVLISLTAIAMLTLCHDTPTGKWSGRHLIVQNSLAAPPVVGTFDMPGSINFKASQDKTSPGEPEGTPSPDYKTFTNVDRTTQSTREEELYIARGEVIRNPTLREALPVVFSLQTSVLMATYFCSFGGELAINSILGAYYLKNFPKLGQTGSGNWAAMFGLLNLFARPAGGIISDLIYRRTNSIWAKKYWLHGMGIICGCFQIVIGTMNSHHQPTLVGLFAGMASALPCLAKAFFLEGGNGANFALLPHVHPFANGIISGLTGAAGNFGGVIFAIVFRYYQTNYNKVIWIIGVVTIVVNLTLVWVNPIPKGQIGGR